MFKMIQMLQYSCLWRNIEYINLIYKIGNRSWPYQRYIFVKVRFRTTGYKRIMYTNSSQQSYNHQNYIFEKMFQNKIAWYKINIFCVIDLKLSDYTYERTHQPTSKAAYLCRNYKYWLRDSKVNPATGSRELMAYLSYMILIIQYLTCWSKRMPN